VKITGIKTYALQTPLARPFAFSQGWVKRRCATVVEVLTDDGTSRVKARRGALQRKRSHTTKPGFAP
jgi:hypothetical protein